MEEVIPTSEPGGVAVPQTAVLHPGGARPGVRHEHCGGGGDRVEEDLTGPGPATSPGLTGGQLALAVTQLEVALVERPVGLGETQQGVESRVGSARTLVVTPVRDQLPVPAPAVVNQLGQTSCQVECEAVLDEESEAGVVINHLRPEVVADVLKASPELSAAVSELHLHQADV